MSLPESGRGRKGGLSFYQRTEVKKNVPETEKFSQRNSGIWGLSSQARFLIMELLLYCYFPGILLKYNLHTVKYTDLQVDSLINLFLFVLCM